MQAELFKSSGEEVEHFFHEFVDQSGEQGVVEGSGLGGYPLVKVFEQITGTLRLVLFVLLHP
jgi:hypothetical protein